MKLKRNMYTLWALFFFSILNGWSQKKLIPSDPSQILPADYQYRGPDGVEKFAVTSSRIALKFKKDASAEVIKTIIKDFPDLAAYEGTAFKNVDGYTLFEVKAKLSNQKEIEDFAAILAKSPKIDNVAPVLIYSDGTPQIPTQRLVIKLYDTSDLHLLKSDALKYNFHLERTNGFDEKMYFANISTISSSALAICQALSEEKRYETVEPLFIRLLEKMNTNDPFINNQWSLNNTGTSQQYNGTPGADMKVFGAWTLQTGSSGIKVAVIDEGVDLNHPDLAANLLPGFDATGLGSNGGPQGNDAHGTACAGIIGAIGNNATGIAGVAYGVKIIPVRIAYSSGSNWVTNDGWISTAIDWAWNNGNADVLSNSWGGGSASTLINDAIGRAVTLGRAGKGAAVLFAAGNNNSNVVSFPATNNNTIAVIAMSMCNQRKTTSSCDGESWWGSNNGLHADVAAPGVKIYTTDISGAAGYSTNDYVSNFNGTSSACPNAAGVMALILSANPALTYAQARQILETSCEKVGNYSYFSNTSAQPNGSWSSDLGYGRVNAHTAVQMAMGLNCTGSPAINTVLASHTTLCSPLVITLSLQTACLPGTTYQWESSSDNINFLPIQGGTAAAYSGQITSTTWFRCVITCNGSTTTNSKQVIYNDPTVTSYPHSQSFGTNTLPCGWVTENVNGDPNTWIVNSTTPRTTPYAMMYPKNTTQAANDWLFSPPLAMTAGNSYGVRFWYKGSSASLPEKLEVKWGNAANAASMTSNAIFSNTNITNTSYNVANTAIITPTSTGTYHVGFKVFSAANMGNFQLDDIQFELVNPCNTPLNGGTISGPTTISAGNGTLSSWTVSGHTGSDLYWQVSANGGSTWTSYAGAITPTFTTYMPTTGNYLLRVVVGSYNCPSEVSAAFPVTVVPRIGDLISNPIIAQHEYYIELNNGPQSGFGSDYTGPNAQASNDVFFRYTTGACTDSIIIGTCGSAFDTYLHILDANGVHLISLDDHPNCGQAAVLSYDTEPSTTYYIVLEGWNTSSGNGIFGIHEYIDSMNLVTISSSSGTEICNSQGLTLTASAGALYFWNDGSQTQSIMVTQPGTYSVTVYDNTGCVGTADMVITTGNITTWYQDNDNDGFGQIGLTLQACSKPPGYVANPDDCNDNNAAVHESIFFYADLDGDGYGGTITGSFCLLTPPEGWADNNTDCDDNNAAIHAGIAYFVDADGDGYGSTTSVYLCSSSAPSGYSTNDTDCDDNNAAVNTPQSFYVDADGDGFGSALSAQLCSASAPSGYASNNTDCDDNNAAVNSPQTFFIDADGDGFGSASSAQLCVAIAPPGYASNNTDCDDNNAAVNTPQTFYEDADGDGFGSTASAQLCAAIAPSGYASNNTDCDDNNAAVNTPQSYFVDADGDGYGSSVVSLLCVSTAPQGYATFNGDCDDNNPAVNPGATEICGNNQDDNCNQLIDESCCNLIISALTTPSLCSDVATGAINTTVNNGAAPYSFQWSNGATTEDLNNLAPGNFTITVTDNNGCTNANSFTVTHSNSAPVVPTLITGPSGACRNQTNVLFSTPLIQGATSYVWTKPSGTTGSSTTNSISLNFSNSYNTGNLCVKSANACGMSQSYCRSVVRYTNAPAQPGTITGLKQGVCPNSIHTYSIATVNNATGYTWTAPTNASIVSGQGTTQVTVSYGPNFGTTGTLSVRSFNCIGNSSNRNQTIQRTPTTPSTIASVNQVCPNAQGVTFSVTNVPEYSYNWVVPPGCTIISGQGTNSIVVNWGSGSGTIAVQSIVSCGSVSPYRSKNISVISCSSGLPVISPFDLEHLDLFPNPASQQVTISIGVMEETSCKIDILDIQGKLVLQKVESLIKGTNDILIDLNSLTPGMYWVKAIQSDGTTYTKKMIKE
ncbi:MAG: S8 family serine peptidase [Saprospiraceae bacterium]|nr:S8 family serine peptidase [Saprospiraceae bacterium]